MFERNWRLIFAVAGLTLLAASPPKDAGSQPADRASTDIGKSLSDIAASLKQTSAPSQHDKPCREGQDDRSSDLCAQWKAADAAQSASRAAWWIGCVSGLIGALTLAAAWSAAKWAKNAAGHTGDGAAQAQRAAKAAEDTLALTREVSNADLRAWMSVELNCKEIRRTDNFVTISIKASLKNEGKTPALRVAISLDAFIVSSVVTSNDEKAGLDKHQYPLSSLLPSAPIDHDRGLRIENSDVEQALKSCETIGFPPMMIVDAVVFYHTVFDADDAPKRLTSIRYYLIGENADGTTDRVTQWQWLSKKNPLGYLSASFNHAKSAAIHLT